MVEVWLSLREDIFASFILKIGPLDGSRVSVPSKRLYMSKTGHKKAEGRNPFFGFYRRKRRGSQTTFIGCRPPENLNAGERGGTLAATLTSGGLNKLREPPVDVPALACREKERDLWYCSHGSQMDAAENVELQRWGNHVPLGLSHSFGR